MTARKQRPPLVQRVDSFTRKYPWVMISAPYRNPSRKWEVSAPNSATVAYDHGHRMMDLLEASPPPPEPAD